MLACRGMYLPSTQELCDHVSRIALRVHPVYQPDNCRLPLVDDKLAFFSPPVIA